MPLSKDERDKIREQYAGQAGVGHLVEQAAAEQLTGREIGMDTPRADAVLGGFGHKTDADRAQAKRDAAEKRAAAKEEASDERGPAPARQAGGKASRPARDTGKE